MIRNIKALGLAMLAVFAMSAVAASAASAEDEGTFTADDYPAHIDGEDAEAGVFTGPFGINITCNNVTYTGELPEAAHELTVTPTYKECTAGARPATVTFGNPAGGESCDYLFHDASDTKGEETTEHEWRIQSDLNCPEGQQVSIHVYNDATKHAENKSWCTITIGSAANQNLSGLTATVDTGAEDVNVHGTVENVKLQTHGECSFNLTLNLEASLDVNGATITGTDEGANPTGVSIS